MRFGKKYQKNETTNTRLKMMLTIKLLFFSCLILCIIYSIITTESVDIMDEYVLVDQDYELISRLQKVSKSIESLYNKLYALEIEDKKDSEDYLTLLDYLKMSIDVENSIYRHANLDCSKCMALIEYLREDMAIEFDDEFESVINPENISRVFGRIFSRLTHVILLDYRYVKDKMPKQLREFLEKNAESPEARQMYNLTYYIGELHESFESDLFCGFMELLQESIDEEDNLEMKNRLIKMKYNLSYLNEQTESDMINNIFTVVPENFIFNSLFNAEMVNFDLEVYNFLKDDYGSDKVIPQIYFLMDMFDEEFEKPEKYSSSIARQCLLRSAFLLLSDDLIDDLNNKFQEVLEREDYLDKHPNDKIGGGLVSKCFEMVANDRTKPIVFSLGAKNK